MTHHHGVGTWIERRARVAGDHIALIYGDTCRTYVELAERVRRLAHGLRALGVARGDRVAWLGPNHPAFLEALFASARIGAILTPINYLSERESVEAIWATVDPRVAFVFALPADARRQASAVTVSVDAVDGGDVDYEHVIAASANGAIDDSVGPDDPCLLPFTSGTTGMPKGITLTHGNLTWNVVNVLSSLDVRSDDVAIATVPFSRAGGTGITVLPVLFMGGTVVIPRSSEPDDLLRLVEAHRATLAFAGPNALQALTRASRWPSANLTSLRTLVSGGAPVPERLLRTFHDRRVNLVPGYGLSEATPLVSVLDASHVLEKIGSAGRPVLLVDIRIAGQGGSWARVGEVGELLVRGPNVMAGYWQHPEATRHAIDEQGWLRTGDAAWVDEDGFLFVVGRLGDAYLVEGQTVHPGLAERVLEHHQAVAEACVVGGADGATAYVVLAETPAADINAELRGLCVQHLAPYARPTAIRYVAALPKNANGKIVRPSLTDLPTVVGAIHAQGERS